MQTTGLVFLVFSMFAGMAMSQEVPSHQQIEAEIRRLDREAAKAILDKDEKAIARLFTADSLTNNPRNGLTKARAGVIEAARTNVINYFSFERNIESVQLLGDTVVVMGNESCSFS